MGAHFSQGVFYKMVLTLSRLEILIRTGWQKIEGIYATSFRERKGK